MMLVRPFQAVLYMLSVSYSIILSLDGFNNYFQILSNILVPEEEQKGPEIAKFPLSMTVALGKSATFTIESKNVVKKGMFNTCQSPHEFLYPRTRQNSLIN